MTRVAFAIADIGVSASSVAAARIASTQGIARNISVQTVLPQVHRVREELAGLPGRAFGLHAAITCEWSHPRFAPLLGHERVPALCDPDRAFCASALVLSERKLPVVDQIMDEPQAQLRCLRSNRIPVTFVDEHMAFSWLPGVAVAMEKDQP